MDHHPVDERHQGPQSCCRMLPGTTVLLTNAARDHSPVDEELVEQRLFMHKAAELVHKKVTIWLRWCCITERFLRLILRRKLWGLTGQHLKTIVDRTDLRSTQLRRVWSENGTDLKAIKARGKQVLRPR